MNNFERNILLGKLKYNFLHIASKIDKYCSEASLQKGSFTAKAGNEKAFGEKKKDVISTDLIFYF